MRKLNLAPFGMLHIICCSRGDMHQSLRLLSLAAICGMVGAYVGCTIRIFAGNVVHAKTTLTRM